MTLSSEAMSERFEPRVRLVDRGSAAPARDMAGGLWSRADIERALGQPLLSPDPMLTTKQAAVLLGLRVNRLRYLLRMGRAAASGGPRWARWRLADLAAVQD